jgi:hypothetical protein
MREARCWASLPAPARPGLLLDRIMGNRTLPKTKLQLPILRSHDTPLRRLAFSSHLLNRMRIIGHGQNAACFPFHHR